MANPLENLIDRALEISFYSLAIVTPLVFTTQTTELFEVPKMFFVYVMAVVIFFLAGAKFILNKKIMLPKDWVMATFGIFVAVQAISTIFSTDHFLSVFGYPTRLNGSLLSQIAYLVIFSAGLLTLTREKALKIFLVIVIAATAVSLWGIPSHFGRDPSCLVLTGNINAACWQQDFNPALRIFSTLGQPNWLASYLVLALPISLSFFLLFKSNRRKLFFAATSGLIFMAIVLTTSRAGILGTAISLAFFGILLGVKTIRQNLKQLVIILVLFLAIWSAFGTLLTSRITDFIKSQNAQPSVSQAAQSTLQSPTSGGTESSQIRFIVWQGAIKVFEHWPLLGSGPETFVSTYFLYRGANHNQTSEWEFFYNKAHNEFLNYLANTGLLGLASYLALLTTIFWSLLKKQKDSNNSVLSKAAAAATLGYLTTIFFGFSVVATQTTLFLIIPAALVFKGPTNTKTFNLRLENGVRTGSLMVFSLICLFVLTFVLRLFFSDVLEKRASSYFQISQTRSLLAYDNAVTAFPTQNPYLMSSFAYAIASYLPSVQDAKSKGTFEAKSRSLVQDTVNLAPNNFLIAEDISKTYLLLSTQNHSYDEDALSFTQKLPTLAPTYPVAYLTLAKTQATLNMPQKAKESLAQALKLKPDYVEAQQLLEEIKANTYNKSDSVPAN